MPHLFTRRALLPVLLPAALAIVTLANAPIGRSQTSVPAPKAKPDGTVRQTARPWTGSPYGPFNSFEFAGRARQLRIETVMDDLKIKRGSVVADIGAGGGWFTLLAARRVGPTGRVYAEEILPKYTRFIQKRARGEGLRNVRVILGTTTDPKLPRNRMDAVMILNAYHEFEQPLAMLKKISLSMKPGARLAFLERDNDFKRRQAAEAIAATGAPKRRVEEEPDGNEHTDDHHLALPIVEREAALAGFAKVKAYELGDDHYALIVEKK
jgi:SAM-dependent methyltransferase